MLWEEEEEGNKDTRLRCESISTAYTKNAGKIRKKIEEGREIGTFDDRERARISRDRSGCVMCVVLFSSDGA